MIELKYCCQVPLDMYVGRLNYFINQCYKILCYREEGKEWGKPLKTIMLEITGLQRLTEEESFLELLSKLESLFTLTGEDDFFNFRRVTFDCLGILTEVKNNAGISKPKQ